MNRPERIEDQTRDVMIGVGAAARDAAGVLMTVSTARKNQALKTAAESLRDNFSRVLLANDQDLAAARAAVRPAAFMDRLALNEKRIGAIAQSLDDIAALPDPVGTVLAHTVRPNGLDISRVRVPIGVVGIIYESRPNVTADAGALCLKSGNAVILRGGSESHQSSRAIHACLLEGLRSAQLPETAIQLIETTDRAAVGEMLSGLNGTIDVIVPRGGKSLVQRVQDEARVPVFAHLEGICHTYIDGAADLAMARDIVINAKLRRTGVCGATECVLIDRAIRDDDVRRLVQAILNAGCEVRGDEGVRAADPRVKVAQSDDYGREFFDKIIAARIVDGVDSAIAHISRYGSQHTDAIVTADAAAADKFLARVDSAIVLWNASTQFADGGEFGMGAEIGIATGKLHARGPVGVEQLTTFKYVVRGTGQTRPD